MQNKPNFQKSQMNVKSYNTRDYENKSNWTIGQSKPNSNPNKANFTYSQRHALSRACFTLHLGRKISGFLIKSLPKIAENRVIMAFIVRKKAEKPLKAELKTQFGKEVKNVLELI